MLVVFLKNIFKLFLSWKITPDPPSRAPHPILHCAVDAEAQPLFFRESVCRSTQFMVLSQNGDGCISEDKNKKS